MNAPPSLLIQPLSIDACLVDLDGTLVHTLGDFVAALNPMLADVLLPPGSPRVVPAGLVERWVGKGSEHLIACALNWSLAQSGVALDATEFDALSAQAWGRYQHHYLRINGAASHVYPGVVAGLEAMQRAGWRLACLTNKPQAFARPLLKAKGLAGYFEHVFGGDAFEHKKPHPQPVLKACEALGTTPGRTLMLGDSHNDAQAARAAGCPVWLVTYGYNQGEPVRQVDADGWIDRLDALPLAAPPYAA
jgi:phosphoglycolate phosphatase